MSDRTSQEVLPLSVVSVEAREQQALTLAYNWKERAEKAKREAEQLRALLREARQEIRGNFGTYAETLRARIDAALNPGGQDQGPGT
jgi:hypothetical protein